MTPPQHVVKALTHSATPACCDPAVVVQQTQLLIAQAGRKWPLRASWMLAGVNVYAELLVCSTKRAEKCQL